MKENSVIIVRKSLKRPAISSLTPPDGWDDHARDLLCMINHFRGTMPRPIVGVGHSICGTELYVDQLSLVLVN